MNTFITEILLKIYEKTELSKQDCSYQSVFDDLSAHKEFRDFSTCEFKKVFDTSIDILMSWHMIHPFYEPHGTELKKCFKIDENFKEFAKITYDQYAEGIAETLSSEQRKLLNQFCCGRNFLSSLNEELICADLEDGGLVETECNLPNACLFVPTILGEQVNDKLESVKNRESAVKVAQKKFQTSIKF